MDAADVPFSPVNLPRSSAGCVQILPVARPDRFLLLRGKSIILSKLSPLFCHPHVYAGLFIFNSLWIAGSLKVLMTLKWSPQLLAYAHSIEWSNCWHRRSQSSGEERVRSCWYASSSSQHSTLYWLMALCCNDIRQVFTVIPRIAVLLISRKVPAI